MNMVTMNGHRRLGIKWPFTDMVDLAGWYVIEYWAGGFRWLVPSYTTMCGNRVDGVVTIQHGGVI